MMLRRGHHIEAGVVGKHGKLAQFIQHLLIPLIVASDRTQPLAVVERTGYRWQHKEHEFHGVPPFRTYCIPSTTNCPPAHASPSLGRTQAARRWIAASASGATPA